jgi:hypothetical protein
MFNYSLSLSHNTFIHILADVPFLPSAGAFNRYSSAGVDKTGDSMLHLGLQNLPH